MAVLSLGFLAINKLWGVREVASALDWPGVGNSVATEASLADALELWDPASHKLPKWPRACPAPSGPLATAPVQRDPWALNLLFRFVFILVLRFLFVGLCIFL